MSSVILRLLVQFLQSFCTNNQLPVSTFWFWKKQSVLMLELLSLKLNWAAFKPKIWCSHTVCEMRCFCQFIVSSYQEKSSMADGSDLFFLEGYLTSSMVCAERVNLALEALIVPCSICNSDFFEILSCSGRTFSGPSCSSYSFSLLP